MFTVWGLNNLNPSEGTISGISAVATTAARSSETATVVLIMAQMLHYWEQLGNQ